MTYIKRCIFNSTILFLIMKKADGKKEDTALNQIKEENYVEDAPETKRITSKQLCALKNAHYPYHSLGLHRHCCIIEEEGRPVTRRNPVDMPEIPESLKKAQTDIQMPQATRGYAHFTTEFTIVPHTIIAEPVIMGLVDAEKPMKEQAENTEPIDAKGDAKTCEGCGVCSRATSPTADNASQTAKGSQNSVAEHEYLQFALRITEDIIRNDLYTNTEIIRVFNSHIEANRGRLQEERMKKQIKDLALELNLCFDENLSITDCRSPDACFGFESTFCDCHRTEVSEQSDYESVRSTQTRCDCEDSHRPGECIGSQTDKKRKHRHEAKHGRRSRHRRHKSKHDSSDTSTSMKTKSRTSHDRDSLSRKGYNSAVICSPGKVCQCDPVQMAFDQVSSSKDSDSTAQSMNNRTKIRNRCGASTKRDDSTSLDQCVDCRCDSINTNVNHTPKHDESIESTPTVIVAHQTIETKHELDQRKHPHTSSEDHRMKSKTSRGNEGSIQEETTPSQKRSSETKTAQGLHKFSKSQEIDGTSESLKKEHRTKSKTSKEKESSIHEGSKMSSDTKTHSGGYKSSNSHEIDATPDARKESDSRKSGKLENEPKAEEFDKSAERRQSLVSSTNTKSKRSSTHSAGAKSFETPKSRRKHEDAIGTDKIKPVHESPMKVPSEINKSLHFSSEIVNNPDVNLNAQSKSDNGKMVLSRPSEDDAKLSDHPIAVHPTSSILKQRSEQYCVRSTCEHKDCGADHYYHKRSHHKSLEDTQRSDRSRKRSGKDKKHRHRHKTRSKSSASSDNESCNCMNGSLKKQPSVVSVTQTCKKCHSAEDDARSSASTVPSICRAALKPNLSACCEKLSQRQNIPCAGINNIPLHVCPNVTTDTTNATKEIQTVALKTCSCGPSKIASHTSTIYTSLMREPMEHQNSPIQTEGGYLMLPGPIYVPHQAIGLVPPMMPYFPPGLKTITVAPPAPPLEESDENDYLEKRTADKDICTQTKAKKSICFCPVRTPARCNLKTCFAIANRSRDDLLLSDDYDSGMPPSVIQFFPTISTQTTSSDFLMIEKILAARPDTKERSSAPSSTTTSQKSQLQKLGSAVMSDVSSVSGLVQDHHLSVCKHTHSLDLEGTIEDEGGIIVENNIAAHREEPVIIGATDEHSQADEQSHETFEAHVDLQDAKLAQEIAQQQQKEEVERKQCELIGPSPSNVTATVEMPTKCSEKQVITPIDGLPSTTKMPQDFRAENSFVGQEDEDLFETANEDTIVGVTSSLIEPSDPDLDESDEDMGIRRMSTTDSNQTHTTTSRHLNSNVMVGEDDDDFMKKLDYKPRMSMTTSMEKRIKKVVRESELFRHPEEKLSGVGTIDGGIDLMVNDPSLISNEENRNVIDLRGLTHSKYSVNDASKRIEQTATFGTSGSTATMASKG